MQTKNNLVSVSAQRGGCKRFSEMFVDDDEVAAGDTPSKCDKNTNPCSVDAPHAKAMSTDKNANSDRRGCHTSSIRECHNGPALDGLTSSVVESRRASDGPAPRLSSSSARKGNRGAGDTSAPGSKAKSSVAPSEVKVKSSTKRKGTHSSSKSSTKSRAPCESAGNEKENASAGRSSKTHSSRTKEEPVQEAPAHANLCTDDTEQRSTTSEPKPDSREALMLDEEDVCCICLETYEDDNPKFTAPCTHHFHLACLLDWKQRNNTCPMCCAETLRGVGGEEVVPPPPTNLPDCTMDETFARRLQVHYLTRYQTQRGRGTARGGPSSRPVPVANAPQAANGSRPMPQLQRQGRAAPQQNGGRGRSQRNRGGHGVDSSDKKDCAVM